jgi:hypothetical protein
MLQLPGLAVLNAIAMVLFQKKLKNNSVWHLFLKCSFNLPYNETCRQGFLQAAHSFNALGNHSGWLFSEASTSQTIPE